MPIDVFTGFFLGVYNKLFTGKSVVEFAAYALPFISAGDFLLTEE